MGNSSVRAVSPIVSPSRPRESRPAGPRHLQPAAQGSASAASNAAAQSDSTPSKRLTAHRLSHGRNPRADTVRRPQSARAAALLGLPVADAPLSGTNKTTAGSSSSHTHSSHVQQSSAAHSPPPLSRGGDSSGGSDSNDSDGDPSTLSGSISIHGSLAQQMLGIGVRSSAVPHAKAFAMGVKGGTTRAGTPPRGAAKSTAGASSATAVRPQTASGAPTVHAKVPTLRLGSIGGGAAPGSGGGRPTSARQARLAAQASAASDSHPVVEGARPATARERARPVRPATALLASAAQRERGSTANHHTWALRGVQGGQGSAPPRAPGVTDPLVAILSSTARGSSAWAPPPPVPGVPPPRRPSSASSRPDSAGSDWLGQPMTARDPGPAHSSSAQRSAAAGALSPVDAAALLLPAERNDVSALARLLGAEDKREPSRCGQSDAWWLWRVPRRRFGVEGGATGAGGRGLAGFTPLHYASSRGHEGSVWLLLAAGANVDAQANDKSTPLHSAAEGGHVSVLRLLLAFGARASCQDEFGETPLHIAGKTGNVHSTQALLAAGASALVVDRLGDTPAEVASKPAVVRALQSAEATQRTERRGVDSKVSRTPVIQLFCALPYCDESTRRAVYCASGVLAWLGKCAEKHILIADGPMGESSASTPRERAAASSLPQSSPFEGGVVHAPAASATTSAERHSSRQRPRQRAAATRNTAAAIQHVGIADPALASFHSKLKRSSRSEQ